MRVEITQEEEDRGEVVEIEMRCLLWKRVRYFMSLCEQHSGDERWR